MDCALIFCLLVCVAQAHDVLQWSASSPADGASVPVCEGQEAVLDWNFTLGPQEHLEDIRWLVSKGAPDEIVASFTVDSLLVSQNFSGRVRHLGNAAIAVDHVMMEDSGIYSVDVHVSNASGKCVIKARRSVSLNVVASLKLVMRQSRRAVYNKDTGENHVKLECGQFGDLQQPFVDVIWKTPSGSSLPSSNYDNGYFELLLDNPVQGGNYSCHLNPNAQAALCFHDNDTAMKAVKVTVDEVKARLTLIEAHQTKTEQDLKSKNAELTQELRFLESQHEEDIANLTNHMHSLQSELSRFQETAGARASFFARLSSDTTVSEPSPVILTKIYNNEGGAYNPSTGSFVVPRNGTYSITAGVQAVSSGTTHTSLYLMVDDEWMCTAHSHHIDGYQGASCTAVLPLMHGQRVWLKSEGTSYFGNRGTFFTGILLYADADE